ARAHSYRSEGNSADAASSIMQFFRWLADGDRPMFINFAALWAFSARWSEKLESIVDQATQELLAPMHAMVARGIEDGTFRNVDPAAAGHMLWVAYMAGLRRAAVHQGTPRDALPIVE